LIEAFEAALVPPELLSKQAIDLLIDLIEPSRKIVFDGDLRLAGQAGEFKLGLCFELSHSEATFLAALRARDIDAVRRHFEVPLTSGVSTTLDVV
jgi:hypothetical protein